jgi:hypothetical protein
MAISLSLLLVLMAILGVLIATAVAFGHRCSDRSGKLEEKSAIDELNEIRMAIRADSTAPALARIVFGLKLST